MTALPEEGDVFEVDTYVFANGDHADHRWVAVVRPPATASDLMTVIQRSSTATDRSGLDSPKSELPCCTRDGRWVLAYTRTVRWPLFEPAIVHKCGRLSDESVRALVGLWEAF